jgi:hypothetical protein
MFGKIGRRCVGLKTLQQPSVGAAVRLPEGQMPPIGRREFEQLAGFRDEMRSAEANWELDIYGGARHSFTGEGVIGQAGPEAGLHSQSEERSWRAMLGFLTEVLGGP